MPKSKRKYVFLRKLKIHTPFDFIVYFFTFVTPLFEIPQAIQIFSSQSAQDVSIWTWGFFCIDNLVWIVYGVKKKLWPVVITSALYEIFELSILIGILMYRY